MNEEGGFDAVCRERRWTKISVKLGFAPGKAVGSHLRAHYERILYPYNLFQTGDNLPVRSFVLPELQYSWVFCNSPFIRVLFLTFSFFRVINSANTIVICLQCVHVAYFLLCLVWVLNNVALIQRKEKILCHSFRVDALCAEIIIYLFAESYLDQWH